MKKYFSLVVFSHSVFALPFAFMGFFMALRHSGTDFSGVLALKILACMVLARTSAMAFNRYSDRYWDQLNPRTSNREIPSGSVPAGHALILAIISGLCFIGVTWFINPLCFYLSPVALGVIWGYSWSKQFTRLCHLILGLGLGLAPLGAWLAVTGSFALPPIVLGLGVALWVAGFDIIYALQDREFDKENQLYSLPEGLGAPHALMVSKGLHALSLSSIVWAGALIGTGIFYWIGCVLFLVFLVRQHLLVSPTDLSQVNRAFFTMNGYASVLFFIFYLADHI